MCGMCGSAHTAINMNVTTQFSILFFFTSSLLNLKWCIFSSTYIFNTYLYSSSSILQSKWNRTQFIRTVEYTHTKPMQRKWSTVQRTANQFSTKIEQYKTCVKAIRANKHTATHTRTPHRILLFKVIKSIYFCREKKTQQFTMIS